MAKSTKRKAQSSEKARKKTAAYRAGGNDSKYAQKKRAQGAGIFSDGSPFKAVV